MTLTRDSAEWLYSNAARACCTMPFRTQTLGFMKNHLDVLRELETELHQPEVRQNPKRLDALLHDAFTEIGSSGTVHGKADTLQRLSTEDGKLEIRSEGFDASEIAPGITLLTYRIEILDHRVGSSRRSLRSSLWQLSADGWKMRFHQGTPVPLHEI